MPGRSPCLVITVTVDTYHLSLGLALWQGVERSTVCIVHRLKGKMVFGLYLKGPASLRFVAQGTLLLAVYLHLSALLTGVVCLQSSR